MDIRVNATDYDGEIVIEQRRYWGAADVQTWAVPAWDEMGLADFAGPFATVADAEKVVAEYYGEDEQVFGWVTPNAVDYGQIPEKTE